MTKLISSKFKVGLWKSPSCFPKTELTSQIAKWLLFPGSFTEKIQAFNSEKSALSIKILKEGLELAKKSSYEFELFNCHYLYFREIQIIFADKLIMYAKSVMPKDTKFIYKRQFRGLKQRPLGEMLFSSPLITRGPFELIKIWPDNLEYKLACCKDMLPYLWARRSTFSAQQDLILLYEVFSPDLIKLISQ